MTTKRVASGSTTDTSRQEANRESVEDPDPKKLPTTANVPSPPDERLWQPGEFNPEDQSPLHIPPGLNDPQNQQVLALLRDLQGQVQSILKHEDELSKSNQTLVSVVDRLYKETSRLREETNRLREIISPHNYGMEELEEEIKHNRFLIHEYRKRLRLLEIRQAREGIGVPAEIEMEITDTQKRIGEIEAKVKILEFDLAKLRFPDENNDNN